MVPEGYAHPRSVTDLRLPRADVAPSRLACGHQPLTPAQITCRPWGACWALPLTLTQLYKCANACRSDSLWRARRATSCRGGSPRLAGGGWAWRWGAAGDQRLVLPRISPVGVEVSTERWRSAAPTDFSRRHGLTPLTSCAPRPVRPGRARPVSVAWIACQHSRRKIPPIRW